MKIVQVLTLIFVAAYTVITGYAVVLGNRAFIYFDHAIFEKAHTLQRESNGQITLFNLPTSTPEIIAVRFAITNAGGTPTKDARVMLGCKPIAFGDDIHRQEPFSLFTWDEKAAVSEIFGPKQTNVIGPCELDVENAVRAQMGAVRIIFMGEIRYWDAVIPWPFATEHVTQFAQELVVIDFDQQKMTMTARTRSIGRHNCSDDDCRK